MSTSLVPGLYGVSLSAQNHLHLNDQLAGTCRFPSDPFHLLHALSDATWSPCHHPATILDPGHGWVKAGYPLYRT